MNYDGGSRYSAAYEWNGKKDKKVWNEDADRWIKFISQGLERDTHPNDLQVPRCVVEEIHRQLSRVYCYDVQQEKGRIAVVRG